MNFELTDDQKELRREIVSFARKRLNDDVEGRDRVGEHRAADAGLRSVNPSHQEHAGDGDADHRAGQDPTGKRTAQDSSRHW